MPYSDYLVVGSGIAGLTFAIKMAEAFPERSISIVTKSDEEESNSKYAQGGVAAVWGLGPDTYQKHIEDTLTAGDGLSDPLVVRTVIEEGPQRIPELIDWGVEFDTGDDGRLHMGREGGHSERRILHHKDQTGMEIERKLLNRVYGLPNIRILQQHFTLDVITEHQLFGQIPERPTCYGAYVLNAISGEVLTFRAGATLLATGGIGLLYGHTTNPSIATGDGIAMAYRARAQVRDMEFVQFHPTVLYDNREGQSFLISEAVRGFGAYLRNKGGQRFMVDCDSRAELAPRDIVARCMDQELKKSGDDCLYLDCTHLDTIEFMGRFPAIYRECLDAHIRIDRDWIPVVPAAHYLCGGIEADLHGRTSVSNLFACGECARTGLHGANRLASNSLLESLVFGHRLYEYLAGQELPGPSPEIPDWDAEGTTLSKENILITHNLKQLQALMRNYVGIVRSTDRLAKALLRLELIYEEVDQLYRRHRVSVPLCELRNLVNVAYLIIAQSLERKENRGGFYNRDQAVPAEHE